MFKVKLVFLVFSISLIVSSFSLSKEQVPIAYFKLRAMNVEDTLIDKSLEINSSVFIDYLNDTLWSKRDAYDAAHILMIPLHYAVKSNDDVLLNAFESHFAKFYKAYKANEVLIEGLNELQYLSLFSRYLALTSSSNKEKELKSNLYSLLNERFNYYWNEKPAWQWGRDPFQGGIKERIRWKLENIDERANYYNVFHDADFFAIGIAADLMFYAINNNSPINEYEGAIDLFFAIMDQRLDLSKQGWVFQLDYWLDHSDYSYSGYFVEPNEEAPKITANSIQEDASHGHRWPLWLAQVSQVKDISEISERLKWQFLNVIIEDSMSYKAGIPILNNYMCGHNGYYRWAYQTHKNEGYAPYKLSGTFSLGWWSLLNDKKIAEYYLLLANAFPLNDANKSLYLHVSSRKRNSKTTNSYNNGMRQQIAKMSVFISTN